VPTKAKKTSGKDNSNFFILAPRLTCIFSANSIPYRDSQFVNFVPAELASVCAIGMPALPDDL
jgi:hypothetical protein